MVSEKIKLNSLYSIKGGELYAYIATEVLEQCKSKRPALIVCPGGNYEMVSKLEGENVAFNFLAKGFQVFVLHYLCKSQNVTYPEQLLELACSVDYIKKNCKKYSINPKEVFAIGFSAGGHLVGNLAVNNTIAEKYIENIDCKVTAAAMGYPVISPEYGFKETHINLLGGLENERLVEETSLDKQVNKKSAPTFIWTTVEDNLVPCMNSIKFANALAKNNVKFELHIYPHGRHGLTTCDKEINGNAEFLKKNAQWIDNCVEFFRDYCIEKY